MTMSEHEVRQRKLMLIDKLLTSENEATSNEHQELNALLADIRDALRGLAWSLLLTHDIYAEGEVADSYEEVWRIDDLRKKTT